MSSRFQALILLGMRVSARLLPIIEGISEARAYCSRLIPRALMGQLTRA